MKKTFMFMIKLEAKYDFCRDNIPLRDEEICLEDDVEKRLQKISNLSKAMYILGMLQGYEQLTNAEEYERFKQTQEAREHYHYWYEDTKEDFEDDGEIWV